MKNRLGLILAGMVLAVLLEAFLLSLAGTSRASQEDDRFPVVLVSVCGGQPMRDTRGNITPLVMQSREELVSFLAGCNAIQAAYEQTHPDVMAQFHLRCGVETPPKLDSELTGYTHDELEAMLERTVVRYCILQLREPGNVLAGLVAYRNYYAGLTQEPPLVTVVVKNLPATVRLAIAQPSASPSPAPAAPAASPSPTASPVASPTPSPAPVNHNVGVPPLSVRAPAARPTPTPRPSVTPPPAATPTASPSPTATPTPSGWGGGTEPAVPAPSPSASAEPTVAPPAPSPTPAPTASPVAADQPVDWGEALGVIAALIALALVGLAWACLPR